MRRCDEPPALDTRYVPIIDAQPNTTHHFVVLSPSLVGVWTHYHLERTIPCTGRTTGCLCGPLKLARRWKGYLCCWWPTAGRICLAEVTIDAHRNAPHLFEAGRNLRGMMLGMYRLTAKKNGPVRVFEEGRISSDELEKMPVPVDVMRCLYAIWGIEYPDSAK